MHIDFAMWRTAIWQLIKMDKKKDWEALDVISKWLIATRSAVTLVTVYSCMIAGILAWRDGYFSWVPFLILTLGLFIAHGTNNLLNDYTDFSRGVDKDNYFRTQYGVHPLVQGFFTKPQQLRWFFVSGALATLAGIYALYYTNFNPVVIGLFALGAVVLLAYTYPFKYWGLGEFAIFLIWGPIMIAGVYFVLSGVWNWNVVLAGIPYGLGVASINVGKHIDKHDDDKAKGVGTFPVRAGEAFAAASIRLPSSSFMGLSCIWSLCHAISLRPCSSCSLRSGMPGEPSSSWKARVPLHHPKAILPGLPGSRQRPFFTTASSVEC